MASYPNEPTILHVSRKIASMLPKGRSAFVRRVAQLTGRYSPFLARVGGRNFPIDLTERVSRTLYLYGTFEPAISSLLPKLAAPGDVVVDAGANFGYFTLLCSEAIGPTGKLYAFEPDPRNIERLKTVIAANELANVEHVPLGLFDHVGQVTFNLTLDGEDNLGGSSIITEKVGRNQMQIDITTLDIFAAERGISEIALMKMDIEGAEFQALSGAQTLIKARKLRQLLLEMHVDVIGSEKATNIAAWFTAAGYHAYYVLEESDASSKTVAQFLAPLASSQWLTHVNPHCLFTVDPVPGVG